MRILLTILCFFTLTAQAEVRINFSGEIDPSTLASLEQKIQKAVADFKEGQERAVVVEIDSGGGNLYATLSFVDRIQKAQTDQNFTLITRVRNACESSCTVLFTSGNVRQASRFADFGFHSPAVASRLPKGMNRKDVIEHARERWLAAVARVDAPLSYVLDRKGMLLQDNMRYMSGKELATGYVSEIIK